MGLLGLIALISNATSTGVSALTVASWKQSQRVGDTGKRASGGYNERRCALLHNRSLWISITLSGCCGTVNRLPHTQAAI